MPESDRGTDVGPRQTKTEICPDCGGRSGEWIQRLYSSDEYRCGICGWRWLSYGPAPDKLTGTPASDLEMSLAAAFGSLLHDPRVWPLVPDDRRAAWLALITHHREAIG